MALRLAVIALCVSFAAGRASALTLYVKKTLAAEPGSLKVADLVQAPGELSAADRSFLDTTVASLSDSVLVVPSALFRARFESRGGENLILVGQRALVACRGSASERDMALLDRLVDSMDAAGFSDGVVELSVLQLQRPSASVPVSRLRFDPVRVEKKAGLYSGAAEFMIRDAGTEAGVTLGRISLRVSQEAGAAAQGQAAADALQGDGSSEPYAVLANDAVTVVFHKGAIAIEMPGRAQGSASMGRTVSVYVPESRLTFTGIVSGNKAVSVEIH